MLFTREIEDKSSCVVEQSMGSSFKTKEVKLTSSIEGTFIDFSEK